MRQQCEALQSWPHSWERTEDWSGEVKGEGGEGGGRRRRGLERGRGEEVMEGDKECGQRSGSSRGEEKTQKGAN